MAGPGLRTDNDVRFTDSTTQPDVKEHQQVHDTIARVLNLLGIVGVTFTDGDALVFDSAAGMFVPTPITAADGTSPVTTTYTTAAAGSVFRLLYSGGWPAQRPSSRTDIYFDLYGAPAETPAPGWLLVGDNAGGTVTLGVYQQAVERIRQLELQVADLQDGSAGGGSGDASSLDRANHFGVQPIDSIDGLTEALEAKAGRTAADITSGTFALARMPLGHKVTVIWDETSKVWRHNGAVVSADLRSDILYNCVGGRETDRLPFMSRNGSDHLVTLT